MADPHTLYATAHSLYSGRARSYLIKHGIPFRELSPGHESFKAEVLPLARLPTVPTLRTAAGEVIRDGAAIIEHFEAAAGRPARPVGPRQRIVSALFDVIGCEGLLRPAGGSEAVRIALRGDVTVDDAFEISVSGFDDFSLSLCEIGRTGLLLEASRVTLDLSRTESPPEVLSAGFDAGFLGLAMRSGTVQLPEWLTRATAATAPEVRSFAAGIRQDEAAVTAGLTKPWSNGPVEGHVNRLKVIKRTMYGRAGFALLRARVLWPDE